MKSTQLIQFFMRRQVQASLESPTRDTSGSIRVNATIEAVS